MFGIVASFFMVSEDAPAYRETKKRDVYFRYCGVQILTALLDDGVPGG
jgi:hypothetical protein